MYSVDGDFGKVRVASHLPTQMARDVLSYTVSVGWHRCNDLYRITVDEGGCDNWLVFVTVGGCGQLRLGGGQYELTKNTAGLVPAFAAREYFVPQGGLWEFYWMHVGGNAVTSLLEHVAANYGIVFPVGAAQAGLVNGVEEMLFLKGAGNPSFEARSSQIISGMLHDMLLCLSERGRSSGKERNVVKELTRLLEANYGGKVSIEEVSRSLFVNPAHLTRLFKSRTGFTPYEYLLRYRIMKSKELLLYTDMSVKEVAAQAGFAQPSNFISRFKALESVTPADYRRRTAARSV